LQVSEADLRFAGLVPIVSVPRLSRCHRSIVDELKEVLSEAGDDGDLFAVLTKRIKLVRKGGFQLFAGDVGKLGFGYQRLSLGADELLLKDNDLGRVRLLVFQLGNLISDLLLAYYVVSMKYCPKEICDSRSRLGCTDASMFRMLLMVTRYWS
jgi:hypothetical protein